MTVVLIGLAAFFTDTSTEMIQAIFPQYVLVVLGQGPAILGVILGMTDAVSNIIKGLSGWLSERMKQRKSLVIAGYSISNIVAKPLMGVFPSTLPVFLLKILDRVGKGVRAAPRDALVAYHSKSKTGKAFGIYSAMDTMGAIAGPLLASLLLLITVSMFTLAMQLQFIIIFSLVPGIIAILFLFFVQDVKQKKEESGIAKPAETKKEIVNWAKIKPIMVLASIEFASLNSGFLITRAGEFLDLMIVTLLYAGYNIVYAILSIKAGNVSDKIGRKKIITIGLILLLAATIVMGLPFTNGSLLIPILVPVAFVLFGLYNGFMDPTSKAMVSDLSEKKKGITYGIYYFTVGLLSIPESLLFGWLYEVYGAPVAFIYEAIVLVICIVIFVVAVPETLKNHEEKG